MNTTRLIQAGLFLALFGSCVQAQAEDIDLYSDLAGTTSNPNVLIILDNSSNWSANNQGWPNGKQGEAELRSLSNLIGSLTDKVNVGLMMFTSGAIDGGYARFHIRPVTDANKAAMQEMIGTSSCSDGTNSLNGTPNCILNNFDGSEKVNSASVDYGAAMFEAFKYFGGFTNPANATTDTAGSPWDASHYGPYRYAAGASSPDPKTDKYAFKDYLTDMNLTEYDFEPGNCASNYIIFIGNGFPSQGGDPTLLSGVAGDTSQITLTDYEEVPVTTTVSLGTTAQCYSSTANCTSDATTGSGQFAAQCASYTDSCVCTTDVPSSTPASCPTTPSQEYSYTVTGNIAASETNLGYTSSCYSNTNSCNTADYATECAGASCACAATFNGVSVTSTLEGGDGASCSNNKLSYSVIKTVAASSTDLGYTANCYSSAAACSSDSTHSATYGSQYTSFSCGGTPLTTPPSCGAGTFRYYVEGTSTVTVVNPTGTFTVPTGGKINYADEWAKFLYQTDVSSATGKQNVRTYAINVYKDQPDADQTALMQSMAANGKGKYFAAQSESEIEQALTEILFEVQAVNSVFASSSLPVSVNAQGTYLNQIYMGMFRPDPDGSPRWLGNLKQYKFTYNSTTQALVLADSNDQPAISSAGTGFISPNAVSFWTSKDTSVEPDLSGGFWRMQASSAGGGYDSPDGELVEKGGAAQMLRLANLINDYSAAPGSSGNPRNLYTYCPGGSSCDAQLSATANVFDSSNSAITSAMLGVTGSTDRDDLIKWVRGLDNMGNEAGPNITNVNVRPSIHGDVLHSRPVVINYGGSTGVVVFYGSNDGVYHAVNGNQTGTGAGEELWGFVPSDFFSTFKRQREESPLLLLPSTPTGITPTPTRKDYHFDGPTGVYQLVNADGTANKVYLYLTMRRGGRTIYALDVTTPTNPIVLWKKSSSDTDFGELGQTWSQPKVALVKGNTNPVLIFGAGYDAANEDVEPPTTNTMGRGIFVLDAVTGSIVWSAQPSCSGVTSTCLAVTGMNYSIPSDLTLVDRDKDGKIDRLYATDTGGNVWRVDTEPTTAGTADTWQVAKLAALGCDTGVCSTGVNPRKFFFPADVITTSGFDAIFVGTGDREHPLFDDAAKDVTNRFYMLKDMHPGKDVTEAPAQTTLVQADLFDATGTDYDDSLSGYYITLGTGEKVVNAPTVTAGFVYFGTNQPNDPSTILCADLGVARGYSVQAFSGVDTSSVYDGGGLPPTSVSGVVTVVDSVTGQTRQVAFCIGCGGGGDSGDGDADDADCKKSAIGSCEPPFAVSTKRNRTYWYIENK